MARNLIIRLGACGIFCLGITVPATAQDAAETATILSGQGGTAKAQRSLGSAVSSSLDNASAAIRPARTNSRRSSARRARRTDGDQGIVLTSNDPLEGSDAATYQTSSGTTIRVSGRLNPSASTICVENCEGGKPED